MPQVKVTAIREVPATLAPVPGQQQEPAAPKFAVDVALKTDAVVPAPGGQLTLTVDSATEYEVGKVYDLTLTPAA